jgi:predicted nucleic acid-binding protein
VSGAFFDSSIPLYLLSTDVAKAQRAETMLAEGGTASVQVLNEVANVARRKHALDWTELREFLTTLRTVLRIVPITLETHELGLEIAERHRLGIWDAMILAAASQAGNDVLHTEDLSHGQRISGVEVRNPFR